MKTLPLVIVAGIGFAAVSVLAADEAPSASKAFDYRIPSPTILTAANPALPADNANTGSTEDNEIQMLPSYNVWAPDHTMLIRLSDSLAQEKWMKPCFVIRTPLPSGSEFQWFGAPMKTLPSINGVGLTQASKDQARFPFFNLSF